jgi:enoyl-[acyl-carrier protein] reductase II
MAREYVLREKQGADKMELEHYTLGALKRAVFDGDSINGSLMAGQVVGQITEIRPIAEIFKSMYEESQVVLKKLCQEN